jgi:multiple sugar transport system substrate-binding protein
VRRKNVTRAASVAAAAALLLATAACSSGGTGSGGQVTLKFAYMGTADQQQSWNKLFAEFEKTNPNIKLEAEPVTTDNWSAYANKVATQIAGGDVPDVIQIATEGQQMFASKGVAEPLDSYIKKDQSVIDEYYKDINPNLIQWIEKYGSPDGKTYYLPGEFNTMAMWCNTDVVKAAGATLPADGQGWTWDQFEQFAKTIKANTDAYAFNAETGYFTGVMPWVLTNGGTVLSDDWKTPTFNTPAVVDAATFAQNMVKDGYSPAPGGTFDNYAMTAQGKLACFGGGRWPIIQTRTNNMVAKTQIVPWPTKTGNGSPVGWNSYPIMKASKHKDAAWTFVKYLISKDGSSFFANLGGTIVPARESVSQADTYLANSPTGTHVLYDALQYATPISAPAQEPDIQAAIEDGWKQILSGNVTPADGAAAIQTKLESILK